MNGLMRDFLLAGSLATEMVDNAATEAPDLIASVRQAMGLENVQRAALISRP